MNSLLRSQPSITLQLAIQAMHQALEKAKDEQVQVSIAIVDAGGLQIHMAHMDGAPLHSRDIALNKALTALSFGVPTRTWQKRLENCSAAVRQGLPLQPKMALFGGGEPLHAGNAVIGAIGISGASEQVDSRCAEAAAKYVHSAIPQ
ncbi:heme-binding protein [Pseudomonas sp. MMS21-TM103]|uniref:GlcG/HbpS family heme-binding protein n=1 Tax=Pseudomonas sp. MMS21 TM103 TaxID=2886506 RepID=UPI001EDD471E|nr:heme-binding protein [Pseudomonas sp. MMS21 TM103]MCG4454935.1 heme-binding protein [Pseudomonas sp. MMS21 TM103]